MDEVQVRLAVLQEIIRSGMYKHDDDALVAATLRISQAVSTGSDPKPPRNNPPGTGSAF